jgi:hypothetical protein
MDTDDLKSSIPTPGPTPGPTLPHGGAHKLTEDCLLLIRQMRETMKRIWGSLDETAAKHNDAKASVPKEQELSEDRRAPSDEDESELDFEELFSIPSMVLAAELNQAISTYNLIDLNLALESMAHVCLGTAFLVPSSITTEKEKWAEELKETEVALRIHSTVIVGLKALIAASDMISKPDEVGKVEVGVEEECGKEVESAEAGSLVLETLERALRNMGLEPGYESSGRNFFMGDTMQE